MIQKTPAFLRGLGFKGQSAYDLYPPRRGVCIIAIIMDCEPESLPGKITDKEYSKFVDSQANTCSFFATRKERTKESAPRPSAPPPGPVSPRRTLQGFGFGLVENPRYARQGLPLHPPWPRTPSEVCPYKIKPSSPLQSPSSSPPLVEHAKPTRDRATSRGHPPACRSGESRRSRQGRGVSNQFPRAGIPNRASPLL